MKQKIYVAMSGGVDSAVVAALLVEQGYEVTAVYMKNWSENFGLGDTCPWEKDVEDVRNVSEHLGIPWKVYNFEKEYKARILDYFFSEYKAGRTPNPDIMCNNLVKFDLFAERAFAEGATHIATGHYARRQSQEHFAWENSGDLGLFTALDATKDQVYFLQRISQQQLARAVFPLGSLFKSEVRVLAKHFNLPNAEKKDSQGICFIGDIDVRDFIRQTLQTKPGDIIDVDTNSIVGKHEGLWFYTPGQRHGIRVSSATAPYFVVGKDSENNNLLIGKGRNHPMLNKVSITIDNVSSLIGADISKITDVWASVRYREKPIAVNIEKITEHRYVLSNMATEKNFWAPAVGQGVLLYTNAQELWDQVSEKYTGDVSTLLDIINGKIRRTARRVQVLGGGIIS